jgi:hypothetical protein
MVWCSMWTGRIAMPRESRLARRQVLTHALARRDSLWLASQASLVIERDVHRRSARDRLAR